MRIFFILLYTFLNAFFANVRAQYHLLDSSGSINIKWPDARPLFPGVKLLPGERVSLRASGEVSKNPRTDSHEDCDFLVFCNTYSTTYYTFYPVGAINASVYIKGVIDEVTLPSEYSMDEETVFSIPFGETLDKEYSLTGYFSDNSVNRATSDGTFNLSLYFDNSERFSRIKVYIRSQQAGITRKLLENPLLIDRRLKEYYAEELASLLVEQVRQYPQISAAESKAIMQFAYELDKANPKILLDISKSAFTLNQFEDAKQYIDILLQQTSDVRTLGAAYLQLGKIYEEQTASLYGTDMENASVYYGNAADNFEKCNDIDNQIKALMSQARVLTRLQGSSNYQVATRQLEKARKLMGHVSVYEKAGKKGLYDEEYNILTQPEMDDIIMVKHGLIPFKKDGKWGFLSRSGAVSVNAEFASVQPFREDLAKVQSGTSFGYCNFEGKWVIEPKYQRASDFYEGVAVALLPSNEMILINKAGTRLGTISQKDFVTRIFTLFPREEIPPLSEIGDGEFESQSALIIKEIQRDIERFGYSLVNERNLAQPKDNMISKEQPMRLIAFGPGFKIIKRLDEDYKSVTWNGGSYYLVFNKDDVKLMNSSLQLFNVKYPEGGGQYYVTPVGNGYYSYTKGNAPDRKWGIFNSEGIFVSAMVYNKVYGTFGNLFQVNKDGQKGLVNVKGEFVYKEGAGTTMYLPARHRNPYDYSEEAIEVSVENGGQTTRSILNMDGKILLKPGPYRNVTIYDTKNLMFLVDKKANNYNNTQLLKNGKAVIDADFATLRLSADSTYFEIWRDDKVGIYDLDGANLIPVIYDELRPLNDSLFFVQQNEKWGILTAKNKIYIPLIYDELEETEVETEEDFEDYSQFGHLLSYKSGGKWGLLDYESRKILFAPKYRSIANINGLFVCGLGTKEEDGYSIRDRLDNPYIEQTISDIGASATDDLLFYIAKDQFVLRSKRTGIIYMQATIGGDQNERDRPWKDITFNVQGQNRRIDQMITKDNFDATPDFIMVFSGVKSMIYQISTQTIKEVDGRVNLYK